MTTKWVTFERWSQRYCDKTLTVLYDWITFELIDTKRNLTKNIYIHLSAGLRLEIMICLGQKSCSNKSFIPMRNFCLSLPVSLNLTLFNCINWRETQTFKAIFLFIFSIRFLVSFPTFWNSDCVRKREQRASCLSHRVSDGERKNKRISGYKRILLYTLHSSYYFGSA